jgi:5,10-methylene-tetrahydrofolate dehydrogenase/methenyl tetrahydrofolate cyclohydrolase
MTAGIIDGKAAAAELRADVAREVAELPTAPGLATLLVGDDPASAIRTWARTPCSLGSLPRRTSTA